MSPREYMRTCSGWLNSRPSTWKWIASNPRQTWARPLAPRRWKAAGRGVQAPRLVELQEQAAGNGGGTVVAQPERGGALVRLEPGQQFLEGGGELARIEPAHRLLARQHLQRARAGVVHEVDAEGARLDRFAEGHDGSQRRKALRPAAYPGKFMGAAAVGAGQVDEQYGGVGIGGALRLAALVEGLRHGDLVDVPFFRRGVVAVQVDPGPRRGLAAGAVELEDDLAGVVHAALADEGQPVLHPSIVRAQLRHLGIGARHGLPERQHLAEGFALRRGRRQRPGGIALGDFVLQEGQRCTRRFQDVEVGGGSGRAVAQAGEQGGQEPVRFVCVRQRQAGDQRRARACVGSVDRQRRADGTVHRLSKVQRSKSLPRSS
ncbi:MAG: hypothetical protein IPO57_09920 [Rhodocyclales bacterium]|nr:hypothetical protein [Rhodocyclales bacterium]